MPTRQLVSVDDEAPVPVAAAAVAGLPANGAPGAVVTAASITAPVATAAVRVSSAPPQQSASASGTSSTTSGTSGTSANNSSTSASTEAKTVTVTPKKDGDDESSGKKAKKKAAAAGRSKKGGKELPPNQRTLGSFFGAAGAKKSKPNAKPNANTKPKPKPPSSTSTSTSESTDEVVNAVETTGAGSTSTTTAKPKSKQSKSTAGAGNTKPKAKAAKNKAPPADSTAEATSDKIKAIVLGSSRKKAAAPSGTRASASASINSSGGSPTTKLKLLADGAGIATANTAATATANVISTKAKSKPKLISTAALIGIPNGAIPSQKQIQQQEEREEQERAQEEQKRLLLLLEEEENNDCSKDEVEEAGESESTAAPPSASFVSPTPPAAKNKSTGSISTGTNDTGKVNGNDTTEEQQQPQEPQQKKAKKRATLISVTTAVATEAAEVDQEEHPASMELDNEEKDDHDDHDDVVMIMDDEDNHHHLTDTAAKGSAVEGTKVLDVTLGKDSDDDEADASSNSVTTSTSGSGGGGGGGGDQDVSKKLNFATPNKSKNAPVFGGLDAFAVPISSIKASKKAKAAEAAVIEGNSYVTKRIAKEFDDGNMYRGTVTKYTAETETGEALWHIVYDDDDEEDLNLEELKAAVILFESEEAKAANAVAAPVSAPTTSVAATTATASSRMASASTPAGSATATTTPTEQELPDEFKEVLAKHEALRKRYRKRAEDLVQRSTELSEEEFDRTIQPKEGGDDEEVVSPSEDGQFPKSLLSELAVLIQGSPLSLSTLTSNAVAELGKRSEGKNLTSDIVSTKIKILASRKQYLTPLNPPESETQVDKFEDTQTNLMWRWELTTIELLPATLVKKAKKVVSERRKLQNFFKAVVKLLSSLDKADALFLNAKSSKIKRDSALAKVSADEDKVLKFEREEEKQRLIREAKAQKEKEKLEAKAQKDQAKKAAAEKKELEKKAAAEKKELEKKAAAAKRKEESERKKVEATKAKEEAKRKKEEEKAAKKRKAEAKVLKQRACMASFFGSSSPPRSKTKNSADTNSSPGSADSSEFDSDAFWKSLGVKDSPTSRPRPFQKLSRQAKESRKRKTKEVAVTVFATVMPDNPFDQQPYDEERILKVPNKYKFLAFHEDYRPPYYGTWSKPRSSIVTGRNPLGREMAFLDYDVDSEAEWEEGDDEEGEDCEIDGPDDDEEEDKIDGEEGDTRMYNYDDGWLAQDDEYDVEDNEEDNDEDTLAMRKRKAAEAAEASKKQGLTLARVCVVAPVFGGIPLVEAGSDVLDCPELVAEHVDGAEVKIGKDLLSSHKVFDFMLSSENCLDLFPAPKSKKSKKATDKDGSGSSPSKAQASKEMSQDDLRAFAKFVHNSTLGSKDKVIEELQTALPDITSSRAQATRKLDSIAEKRRLKYGGGVVWEVKSAVLESLNLQASDLNPAPVEKEPEKKAAKSPKRKKGDKKEKDPNAPKRPSSAYIFYSNANRQKLKEANKEASNADLLKLIGESWKALPAEEKQPYEQMAANDKERYQKEMAAYKPEESSEEPAEKKAKTIDIQEVWRCLKFKKVEAADLISDSKVKVLVKHKESLFKASIHKSRVSGDSYDYQIQYFGNKATTLHWKPASHIVALLDEKDEPIVDSPVAAVSDEASSEVAEPVVTAENSKSDASTDVVVDSPAAAVSYEASSEVADASTDVVVGTEPSKKIADAKPAVESPAKSPFVANTALTEPAAEAKVVADDAGNDTNAKQQSVSGAAVAAAEGTKIASASSIDKKPTKSSDVAAKSGKKRPTPVSAGSKQLLASFLKKKAKKN